MTASTSSPRARLVALLSACATLLLLAAAGSTRAEVMIISSANRTEELFNNEELSFGVIPFDGVAGKIVLAEPEDACSPVRPPSRDGSWFLLAKRYSCSFETKVRNAATAGFKAIIIYKVTPDSRASLHSSSHNTQYNLDIPAILLSQEDGELVRSKFLADKGYTALIFPILSNTYLLPFAIVIIVCIFLMVSFLIFQVIKCARDRRKLQRHRLTKKQLKQLLTTVYTKGSQYDTCAICLDEYVESEKLRVLPCGHCYHSRCIDQWLTKQKATCCVCKTKVKVPGMSDLSDSESESEAPRHSSSTYVNASESTPLLRNGETRPTSYHQDSVSIISQNRHQHHPQQSSQHQQPHSNASSLSNAIVFENGSYMSTTPDSRS